MTRSRRPRSGTDRRLRRPGVIGGGWVAYFLARGYAVAPGTRRPDAEQRLRGLVDAAWPALTELGLAPGASVDHLTVAADLAAAVADADVVQESAPEQLDLKRGCSPRSTRPPRSTSSSPRPPRASG